MYLLIMLIPLTWAGRRMDISTQTFVKHHRRLDDSLVEILPVSEPLIQSRDGISTFAPLTKFIEYSDDVTESDTEIPGNVTG